MKLLANADELLTPAGRSREGAWIEISQLVAYPALTIVAPVRERGLKCESMITLTMYAIVAPVRERGLK